MLTIYCDTSIDYHNSICAWACIIRYGNKEYVHSGHTYDKICSHYGELWAIVKALGKAKSFRTKKIIIYSDFEQIPINFKRLANKGSRKQVLKTMKSDLRGLYVILINYSSKFRIDIIDLPREENPAHQFASLELKNSREAQVEE